MQTAERRFESFGLDARRHSVDEQGITEAQQGIDFIGRRPPHAFPEQGADRAIPYIHHPIEVATILACEGDVTDPETLAAALLHDVLEDTAATYSLVETTFGRRVADVVSELTDDKGLSKAARKDEQVRRARTYTSAAAVVRAADQTANLRSLVHRPPPDWSIGRCAAYVAWIVRVADNMPALPARLAEARERAVEEARRRFGFDTCGFSYDRVAD